jgi:hypothetical protein
MRRLDFLAAFVVGVAQLVELLVVVQAVVGSSPIAHLHQRACKFHVYENFARRLALPTGNKRGTNSRRTCLDSRRTAVRLIGQLSNPVSSLSAFFEALEQGRNGLEPRSSRSKSPAQTHNRLGNGEVQRAVVKVLAAACRPMRVAEVHQAVEDLLSLSVSIDSVNSCLSTKARGEDPMFVRTELGVYKLGIDGS